MEQDFCVKGSSIRTKISFARQQWGPEAEQDLMRYLHEEGIQSILDSKWYSYKLYDDLLVHISQNHYQGNHARLAQIGEFSARDAFSATYKAYAVGNFLSTLKKLSLLHGRFYNLGQMEVTVDEAASQAQIHLFGAPFYSVPDLHVARGFYLGVAERMKVANMTCDLSILDQGAKFHLQWH